MNPFPHVMLYFFPLLLIRLMCSAVVETGGGESGTLAIIHANVLPMSGPALADQAILVDGDRIVWVGPSSEANIGPETSVIDASGRWIMPGLVDMHVHIEPDDLEAYVRHGVTSVRNMWGWPALKLIQDRVMDGAMVGPTIYSVSPGLDGTPQSWPQTQFVLRAEDAAGVVRAQKEAGYIALKLYQNLTLEAYDAIVEAAREENLPFVGHVPTRVGLERVLEAGQSTLEHLGGFDTAFDPQGGRGLGAWARADFTHLEEIIQATKASGTAIVPTEAINQHLLMSLPSETREAGLANRRRFISELYRAGIPIMAGTDSGIDVVDAGSSLLDELELLHEAGIPREALLESATSDAARMLGGENEFGSIAPGMRADIIVLDADPREDLQALALPREVILRGVRVEGN